MNLQIVELGFVKSVIKDIGLPELYGVRFASASCRQKQELKVRNAN